MRFALRHWTAILIVVLVKNVAQLLEKLKREQGSQFASPAP